MDVKDRCYDCGSLATHFAPEMYGKVEPPRFANLLCSECANWHSREENDADTGRQDGFAGLAHGYLSARETYTTGRAVLNALWAVKYAR